MADDPRSFSPDETEANRTREQGNGLGQRELDLQADATAVSPDIDEPDNPELDWGEPLEGAKHGGNHANRPHKTEAERGPGRRTIQRNKEINSGRLYR